MFIVANMITNSYIWYVCKIEFYKNPNSDWILLTDYTLRKNEAMLFCEAKAKRIVEILSAQIDEDGYSSLYTVEQVA